MHAQTSYTRGHMHKHLTNVIAMSVFCSQIAIYTIYWIANHTMAQTQTELS